ncbi:hypothetical protein ACQP06_11010 [Nocardia sp. CA-136227]|uniref:hypothetical protein n=1 Tax=Nocardia sp. CA-136227 TaxID=3239979 RepID=UPI003D97DA30
MTLAKDALAEGEHLGVSDYHIELGEPHHIDVTDTAAYVVVPVTLGFNVRGAPVLQTGAVFTVALHKVDAEWLLTAWAWAKGQVQQPH